jgi:glycosyltransferase involved in cell wall biosynthesis
MKEDWSDLSSERASKGLRICFFNWRKDSGIDNDVLEITYALAEEGNKIEFLSPHHDFKEQTGHKNVNFHLLPSFNSNSVVGTILFNFVSFLVFLRIHKKKSFNAIQFTNFGASLSAIFSKFFFNIPLSYNIRAPNIEFFYPLLMPLHLFLLRYSDKIFTVSQAYKKLLVHNYKIPSNKIEAVTDGVNTAFFEPTIDNRLIKNEYNLNDEVKIIMYVGKISIERKLETILRAFRELKLTKPNVKLVFVGDGLGKESLVSLARRLEIVDDVIFVGRVDYRLVPTYISIADILLSPIPNTFYFSLSSPLKTFEYMSMGKPIIASKILPHIQVLSNEVNGILVDPDDFRQYAEAMISLLSDPEKAKKIGEQARNIALSTYDWKIVVRPMLTYFDSLKD